MHLFVGGSRDNVLYAPFMHPQPHAFPIWLWPETATQDYHCPTQSTCLNPVIIKRLGSGGRILRKICAESLLLSYYHKQ